MPDQRTWVGQIPNKDMALAAPKRKQRRAKDLYLLVLLAGVGGLVFYGMRENLRDGRLTRGKSALLTFEQVSAEGRKTIPGKGFERQLFWRIGGDELGFDLAQWDSYLRSGAQYLAIPLTESKDVTLAIDHVWERGPKTHTLLAREPGRRHSGAILVVHDGAVAGSIFFLDENRHFQLRSAGPGRVTIREADPSDQRLDCGIVSNRNDRVPISGPVVPLVVGYDAAARTSAGGVAGIEAMILASVDGLNLALKNSEVEMSMRLVATVEAAGLEELEQWRSRQEGTMGVWVTGNRRVPASTEVLLACRLADMGAPKHGMIHHWGHFMGAGHAADDVGQWEGEAHAWRFRSPTGVRLSTIMAQEASWGPRILWFSDPQLSFQGVPIGRSQGVQGRTRTADPALQQRHAADPEWSAANATVLRALTKS